MQIGYLEPLNLESTGEDDVEVIIRLSDRPPDFSIAARLAASRGQDVPQSRVVGQLTVSFEPATPDGSISGRVLEVHLQMAEAFETRELHEFPWSRVISAASAVRHARRSNSLESWREVAAATASVDTSIPTGKRAQGRPSKEPAFYMGIADRYRELMMQGVRNPTSTIMKERDVPRGTAASWISRARKQGFLEPAHPGRAG